MSYSEARKDVFATVGPALMVCQFAAILEVLHPLLGWVKTGVFTPTIQVKPLEKVAAQFGRLLYHGC